MEKHFRNKLSLSLPDACHGHGGQQPELRAGIERTEIRRRQLMLRANCNDCGGENRSDPVSNSSVLHLG
ncbi:MAG: hypothetical protein ACKOF3_05220, partial [Spartobacteria bacterium]